eukprot:PhF_6_TR40337/c0_g1_i1/m.59978
MGCALPRQIEKQVWTPVINARLDEDVHSVGMSASLRLGVNDTAPLGRAETLLVHEYIKQLPTEPDVIPEGELPYSPRADGDTAKDKMASSVTKLKLEDGDDASSRKMSESARNNSLSGKPPVLTSYRLGCFTQSCVPWNEILCREHGSVSDVPSNGMSGETKDVSTNERNLSNSLEESKRYSEDMKGRSNSDAESMKKMSVGG